MLSIKYFQWVVLLWFTLSGDSLCAQRSKRVINGEPFNGRPFTVYHAIRYFGAMGSLHDSPWFTFGLSPGNIDCGGTLIAPMIFQTACHCVAHFLYHTPLQFIPPFLKDHWEARSYIYVGVSKQYGKEKSMQQYGAINSERFLAHAKCGMLGEDGVISYDYGLIRLDTRWVDDESLSRPFDYVQIGYAPSYTDKQIAQYHVHAIFKQKACMMMGFGDYIRGSVAESDTLRHGWGYLLPHSLCVAKTARIKGVLIPPERRKNVMSWVCMDTIQNEIYETASGDSGGPLTCDDRNFGVLSASIELTRIDGQIERHSLYSTLVHNLYASAINYRYDLIHLMYLNKTHFPPQNMYLKRFSIHNEQEAEGPYITSSSTMVSNSRSYISLIVSIFCSKFHNELYSSCRSTIHSLSI